MIKPWVSDPLVTWYHRVHLCLPCKPLADNVPDKITLRGRYCIRPS